MTRFRIKRVYEPSSPEDGTRVLVMRLWPRGISKSRVDEWNPDLGPSRELLFAYKRGGMPWTEFARRYLAGLPHEALKALRGHKGRITLLCGCVDESRCHRSLLLKQLRKTTETRRH